MKRPLVTALSWGWLALAIGFVYLPVVVLLQYSFQDGRLPVPPFEGPSLEWYRETLSDDDLLAALLNSGVVSILSSLAAVALGFMAAYGLARWRLPARRLQRALLIAPITVSYLVIGLGLLVLVNRIGLGPSLWMVGIGHVVINLPLAFAILAAAIGPPQQAAERAARDLGAGEWQVIRHITLPMLAPSLAAALFLAMTLSWDEFIIAFLLTRFDVTLPVEIFSLLRSGLSPATNAIGSVVFLVSVAAVLCAELLFFTRRR